MANFRSWESDPLFSAAEVVQDSADRMESIFRMLLHEQDLLRSDPSDPKLLVSIDYHKRDLVTALGTTKWQLEDFERAVSMSNLSDSAQVRGYAIPRQKQFIRAMRELIGLVEKFVGNESFRDVGVNMQMINEQDGDGLASFLSGSTYKTHHSAYDPEENSMRKAHVFISSSGCADQSDEIVELQPEDVEATNMNGVEHLDYNSHSLMENKLRIGSQQMSRLALDSSIQNRSYDGLCDRGWDINTFKDKAIAFHRRSNFVRYLRSLWAQSRFMMRRSSAKRRKDGELTDISSDIEGGPLSSDLDLSKLEQGLHCWGLLSRFNICERVSSRLGVSVRVLPFQYILLPVGIFATLILLSRDLLKDVHLWSSWFCVPGV